MVANTNKYRKVKDQVLILGIPYLIEEGEDK